MSEVKIEDVLAERGKRYGEFEQHAEITRLLKRVMLEGSGLPEPAKSRVVSRVAMMKDDQLECIDMIAHKLGRILNGDPNFEDSWRDIAGYTTLVANRLLKDEAKEASLRG